MPKTTLTKSSPFRARFIKFLNTASPDDLHFMTGVMQAMRDLPPHLEESAILGLFAGYHPDRVDNVARILAVRA